MKEQAEKDELVMRDILKGAKHLFAKHGLKKQQWRKLPR
jgi:hypothetical protein